MSNQKITVTVQTPAGVIPMEVDAEAVVLQFLEAAGLNTENVKINGVSATPESTANEGDQVAILPSKNVTGNI